MSEHSSNNNFCVFILVEIEYLDDEGFANYLEDVTEEDIALPNDNSFLEEDFSVLGEGSSMLEEGPGMLKEGSSNLDNGNGNKF